MAMFSDPSFWVGVSFVLFVLLIVYFKVPGQMTKALDDRADRIRQELDDAQKLREEAQALLAEYQRKRTEAEKEAEDIVTQAKTKLKAGDKKGATLLMKRKKMYEKEMSKLEGMQMFLEQQKLTMESNQNNANVFDTMKNAADQISEL